MAYAFKIGSSGKSGPEIISVGTYNAAAAGSVNLSSKTPKYASLVLYQNIFISGVSKIWAGDSSSTSRRSTQNLNLRYSSPTLAWNMCRSYCGSNTGDYLQFSVVIVV